MYWLGVVMFTQYLNLTDMLNQTQLTSSDLQGIKQESSYSDHFRYSIITKKKKQY